MYVGGFCPIEVLYSCRVRISVSKFNEEGLAFVDGGVLCIKYSPSLFFRSMNISKSKYNVYMYVGGFCPTEVLHNILVQYSCG